MGAIVDTSKLNKALQAFIGNTKLEAAREMRIQARVLAMRLMQNTQPSPLISRKPKNNDALLKQSSDKVNRQVRQVYTTPALASYFISKIKMPRGRTRTQNPEQAARAFAGLMRGKVSEKTGRMAKPKKAAVVQAQELLGRFDRFPFAAWTKIQPFDGGDLHKKARFGPRQNIPKNQFIKAVVTNPAAIDRYVKKRQENIGTAKAGWAACAEKLGGARAVRSKDDGRVEMPSWVKRQLRKYLPGDIADFSEAKVRPFIELKNLVSYAGQVISDQTIQQTIDTQILRMINRLGIIAAAEARKAGL
jgi:hypothetical protein